MIRFQRLGGLNRTARLFMTLSHAAIFPLAVLASFLLRFEFAVPKPELRSLFVASLVALFIKSIVFRVMKVHRGSWRHAGIDELILLVRTNAVASVLFSLTVFAIIGRQFPRSIYLLDLLVCLLGTCAAQLAFRLVSEFTRKTKPKESAKRVIVYGAGSAGTTLCREIQFNPALGYKVVGFLDDDHDRRNQIVCGVPVLGLGRQAAVIVDRLRTAGHVVDEIVIAMPSANGRQMQEALANCRAASVACKTVPGVGEMLTGKFLSAQIRDISVTDLLGRAPVVIDEDKVLEPISGKAVLVTGAAGSIGSELCRQVASHAPLVLIALDQAESELFKIDLDLRSEYPKLNLVAVVGDIRDSQTIRDLIRRHSVDTIFHAAAYKHVPLMERHPLEAIRNNVLGTWNLATAAYESMVSTFVMISTDKAVNPTSLMGATKRAAEILLSGMPQDRTRFVSVRFGNVLGSNGSVIPLFKRQIEKGGPVTVTHPEMRRYFMITREAVQLVLLASTFAKKSEILVLDMGEPVRIVDLAKQMIRLSGLEPDKDIEIRFTGLRPGEKLYEELALGGESMKPTIHKKIWVLNGHPADAQVNHHWLGGLQRMLEFRDSAGAVNHLRRLIPEYVVGGSQAPSQSPEKALPKSGEIASSVGV